jgi:hypothetical protein
VKEEVFFFFAHSWVESSLDQVSIYEAFWGDEMKQALNPLESSSISSSIQSSIQIEQIYILKREKTRKKIKTEKHLNN